MEKKIILFIFLLLGLITVHSQNIVDNKYNKKIIVESKKDTVQSMLDEYEKVQLPPLSTFLASAENHPSALIYRSRVDEANAEYQIVKNSWMDYVRGTASYSYGYNNSYSNLYNPDDPVIYNKNKNAQNSYSVGAYINIPLGDIINQKQKRKKQKAVLEELKYEYQMSLEDRKLMILKAYNDVVEQLSTIKVKSEAAALYNAQMKISEDDYLNGKITLIALSLERSRRSGALSIYQEARVALHNSITLLEMLTNVTIMKN